MKKREAFTLSEILITLVVIGVVAAVIIPIMVQEVNQRVFSERQANIVYKITQATNLMRANGELNKFENTDAFGMFMHMIVQDICIGIIVQQNVFTEMKRSA